MAEEIVLSIDVEVEQGAKSLRTLKQEFKDTQKELDGAVIGSEKYYNTLRKLGDLKGEMGDLNATINAFDGENKIGALSNAIGGVASGFQAAVGATALFGSESEELNKTLLKVQATMAFTEGIKGVMAMGESFAALNAVIAANPITAVVTGVTLLTTAVYGYIKAQDEEIENHKELLKLNEARNKQREKEIEHLSFLKDLETDKLEQQLNVAKARGASETELYNLEKTLLNKRVADLLYVKETRGRFNKEEALEYRDLKYQIEVLEAEHQKKMSDMALKAREEKAKAQQAEMDSILADEIAKAEREGEEIEKEKADEQAQMDKILEQAQREADLDTWLYDEKDKKRKEDEALEQKAINDRITLAQGTNNALQTISNALFTTKLNNTKKGSAEEKKILKRQFQLNKAFNSVKVIVDTASAVAKAVSTSPLTYGLPWSGFAAATGVAQLAAINSAKFNDGGDGGGGGTSLPVSTPTSSVSSTAPQATNAPAITPTASTQLTPTGQVASQQNPIQQVVKAVVVETDVTTVQNKVKTIKDRSVIE